MHNNKIDIGEIVYIQSLREKKDNKALEIEEYQTRKNQEIINTHQFFEENGLNSPYENDIIQEIQSEKDIYSMDEITIQKLL